MDRDLRIRERAEQVDPQNVLLKRVSIARDARYGNSCVYLEALRDIDSWNQTPQNMQDLAIEEILNRLGSDWSHVETTRYASRNKKRHRNCKGFPCPEPGCGRGYINKTFSCRIGVFRYAVGGVRFHLVPGLSKSGVSKVKGAYDPVKPFLIAKTATTRGQYYLKAVEDPNLPVVNIGIPRIEGIEDKRLRLPSVDEWLHSAAAGAETNYYWGEKVSDNPGHVWADFSRRSNGMIRDVRSRIKFKVWNAFGLVDMFGNVQEMVGKKDHMADDDISIRLCGGSSHWSSEDFRNTFEGPMATRFIYGPSDGSQDIGFRMACSIPGI